MTLLLFLGCDDRVGTDGLDGIQFREEMRQFVEEISSKSKSVESEFIVIPQNGHELLVQDGSDSLYPDFSYLSAIDGIGREELFYGYTDDNIETPGSVTTSILPYLILARNNAIQVLVTDYCNSSSKINDSYIENFGYGFISFAATNRDLDVIPGTPSIPFNSNSSNISSLNLAKNFLYLIDPSQYQSKNSLISDISDTDYDLVILDAFFDETPYSEQDIISMKTKSNGGSRLVIAYLSIGEAEDYRYYWEADWESDGPTWLLNENPYWEGNYQIKYWDDDWKTIIDGYLDIILESGFDGVYLDLIDAYEYFED